MAQQQPNDKSMLQNLSQILYQQQAQQRKRPAITDQDILRAMLGKPFQVVEVQKLEIRKAG